MEERRPSASPGPERPPEVERSERLAAKLRRISDSEGPFGLDRYMEVVLYDPVDGYYRHSDAAPVGPRGDFYTAPDLGPVFGAALARRVVMEFHRLGDPSSFDVVEVGPGRGTLASALVAALARSGLSLRGWTYDLVGEATATSSVARARLKEVADGAGLEIRERPSVGAEGPFTGIVIANELLDALPARRLEFHAGRWQEVGVRWTERGGEWAPMARPIDPVGPAPPPADEEGARLEYSWSACGLVREVADHLNRGTAVWIDYGEEELELVRGHPEGTLRAVRQHRVVPNVFESPGLLDLSTFVNLTRARRAAGRSGLEDRGVRSQAVALGDWGVAPMIEEWVGSADNEVERVRRRLQAKNLLFGFDGFFVWEVGARERPEGSAT